LALIQEANSIDVDNVDFIQVQSRRLSELLDFGPQITEDFSLFIEHRVVPTQKPTTASIPALPV
jgi:hypothetical protein